MIEQAVDLPSDVFEISLMNPSPSGSSARLAPVEVAQGNAMAIGTRARK
jgi:hypothetical protein